MDLGLYLQVARRHQRLVLTGLAVTVALVLLAYVRIGPSGIGYRSSQTWSNDATLALSQPGYPEYRSALPNGQTPSYGTISGLTDLYAAYATSDAVVSVLKKKHLIDRVPADGLLPIKAFSMPSPQNGAPTPLITITAEGSSAAKATKLVMGTTDALIAVLTTRQKAAKIPASQQIAVRVVKRAGEPKLVVPRSKTPAIVLLFAGLTLTFGAAFIRDNLQRTSREASEYSEPELVEVKLSERRQPTPVAPAETKTASSSEDEVPASDASRWSAQSAR